MEQGGSNRGEDDRDDREDCAKRIIVVAIAVAAKYHRPEQHVGDHRDHADHHCGERHQSYVAITDVRHLMGHHAFEFALIE